MRKHLMHRKAGSVTMRKPSVKAPAPPSKTVPKDRHCMGKCGVADGARTHDNRNHNPGLYQLSYSHRRLEV